MSDYMFVLESHLDAAQNRAVAEMQRIATEAGMNVWLTGGAMRDVLRGARISDLDFTVEHDAVKTGKALAQAMSGTVLVEDPPEALGGAELPGEYARFRLQRAHGEVFKARRQTADCSRHDS